MKPAGPQEQAIWGGVACFSAPAPFFSPDASCFLCEMRIIIVITSQSYK